MSYYPSDRSRPSGYDTRSSGYDTRSSGYDTRGYPSSQTSSSRPSRSGNTSSYASGGYDDVTSSMGKLSVSRRPAAPAAPSFDERAVLKMLKEVNHQVGKRFKVRFPKWKIEQARPQRQAAQGYGSSSQGYGSSSQGYGSSSSQAYPSKSSSSQAYSSSSQSRPKPSSSSKGGYKYNCDCGKGFDRSKEIDDHLDRHRKHREIRRK